MVDKIIFDVKEEKEVLEQYLPWSLTILSLLESKEYISEFRSGLPGNICLLNKLHEWIVFVMDTSELRIILDFIYSLGETYRVVINSKESIDLKLIEHRAQFHVEDLMFLKAVEGEKQVHVRLADKDDVLDLAKLQRLYCHEEVNWRYYHKELFLFEEEYNKNLELGNVFVIGSPLHSKVEIVSTYDKHVRIGRIYTDCQFRRNGYGRACLQELINWCSASELEVSLTVRYNNVSAKNMYLITGFKIIGKVIYLIVKGD